MKISILRNEIALDVHIDARYRYASHGCRHAFGLNRCYQHDSMNVYNVKKIYYKCIKAKTLATPSKIVCNICKKYLTT